MKWFYGAILLLLGSITVSQYLIYTELVKQNQKLPPTIEIVWDEPIEVEFDSYFPPEVTISGPVELDGPIDVRVIDVDPTVDVYVEGGYVEIN